MTDTTPAVSDADAPKLLSRDQLNWVYSVLCGHCTISPIGEKVVTGHLINLVKWALHEAETAAAAQQQGGADDAE